jgi:hypothetical protein
MHHLQQACYQALCNLQIPRLLLSTMSKERLVSSPNTLQGIYHSGTPTTGQLETWYPLAC